MIVSQLTSLNSRIARRILAVFLICGLLPFAFLTTVSFYEISSFFYEKSQRRLHSLTKELGADVLERLLLSHSSLQILAAKIAAEDGMPDANVLQELPDVPTHRWQALAVFSRHGGLQTIWGDATALKTIGPSQYDSLSDGAAVLRTEPVNSSTARVIMVTKRTLKDHEPIILMGELANTYLWHNTRIRAVPAEIQPCYFSLAGMPLNCSYTLAPTFKDALIQNLKHNNIGGFSLNLENVDYQVSYRAIPNQHHFDSPNWIVASRISADGVFQALSDLKYLFILSIIAGIGLALLMSIYQLRKRLGPVTMLQEGTRRVADREFNHRVKISTGDEFEELATSLNSMTQKLGQQFHRLEATGEIDRAVLSLLDTAHISYTILRRINSFLGWECSVIALVNPDFKQAGRSFALGNSAVGGTAVFNNADFSSHSSSEGQVSSNSLIQWPRCDPFEQSVAESKGFISSRDISEAPEWASSEFVQQNRFVSCVGIPLLIDQQVLGVMSCYSRRVQCLDADELEFLNGIKDQAAIGLFNAQLFERTNQQAEELAKANKLKDEFLGIVSHELRTPINIMQGFLTAVREKILGELNDDQVNALKTVTKHSHDLLEMIESIMDVTKIEAGAVVTECQPTNISELMESLKLSCVSSAGSGVNLAWNCAADIPIVNTDQAKLIKILRAAIDNALKFTQQGKISIAARLVDRRFLELTVEDTGVGIPSESLPHIFDRFQQSDSSNNREFGGLGLGLFIARRYARMLGGEVTAESQIGVGSVFHITIPLDANNSVAAAA